jgi:alpha-beta hydrolase superfamily lysophospholipase
MITMALVTATGPASPSVTPVTRRSLVIALAALPVAACASVPVPPQASQPPVPPDGHFAMRDGARLPYRVWLPQGQPRVVALALHGFDDSRDAWEIPAGPLTEAGWAVYAPDQRGFGQAPVRGHWAGSDVMADDAGEIARILRGRHPGANLIIMGESMGGAIAMCLATGGDAPPGARYVLVAPAVWGRAQMSILIQGALWLACTFTPGTELTGAPVKVTASDNREALIRLSRDPLTIHATRVDTLRGLVNLMSRALAAAPRFRAPGLFLYGGKDELVPKDAMAAMWRALPPAQDHRLAYYPDDYHLMLRDLQRARPIGDIIAWTDAVYDRLPSGADIAARGWLGAAAAA